MANNYIFAFFMMSSLESSVFQPHTDAEHRRRGEEYCNLSNPTMRKNFVKEYPMRFMQLSQLPYFDIVKQIVVDPMHNLFLGWYQFLLSHGTYLNETDLGLVKTHFYNIWVQNKILRPNHELRILHEMLPEIRAGFV